MTGPTKVALVFMALLLLFSAALPAASALGDREVTWNDYRTPLTGVPVLFSEPTIIWVDLPEEFLKGRSQVTLVWTVMSRVSSAIEGKMRPSFEFCQPQLHIGQGLASGRYDPPIDPRSGLATLRLEVKTKHLRPGKNKIKAMCDRPAGGSCPTFQFIITEMYFQETVSGQAAAAPAPAPASSAGGEDKGSPEERQTLARKYVAGCAMKFALPMILRQRASRELPQNAQGEADRILNSKDWDPLVEELTRALAERCSVKVLNTITASGCERLSKGEPCTDEFSAFLETLLSREMLLLRQELKKKFPDL